MKGERDYCRTYKTTDLTENITVGLCEVQGRREEQQDCLAVSELVNFNHLSNDQQKTILNETLQTMQAKYGKKNQGTTGCVATAWLDKQNKLNVLTANVGDSSAYYIILNNAGGVKESGRINSLHNYKNKTERARVIRENGKFIYRGTHHRLNGTLALTRALGDNKYDNKGISHDCEMTDVLKPLDSGDKAFIVVACDGLDNLVKINKKTKTVDIGQISAIVRKHHEDVTKIAYELVNDSLNQISYDNISAAVFAVTYIPTSAAVFDGHGRKEPAPGEVADYYGGNVIAQNIGNGFYPELRKNLNIMQRDGAEKLKEINAKQYIEIANERAAKKVLREQKKEAEKKRLAAEKIRHDAEMKQQYINGERIKKQMEQYIPSLPSSENMHIFAHRVHSDIVKCELVFATDVCEELRSIIQMMAEAKALPTCEYAIFSQDGHPVKRFAVIVPATMTELPAQFHAFITEVQKLTALKKEVENEPVEEKYRRLAEFKANMQEQFATNEKSKERSAAGMFAGSRRLKATESMAQTNKISSP